MKQIIYSAILTGFLSVISFAQNEIVFEKGTFQQIKEKALKENKLIFVDAFTTWCGPCKQMAKSVFTDKKVADFYNSNFVNAKIDMEKGEGIEIAKMYEVKCYPNLLFIDGNGKLVHRIAGSMLPDEFIELGKKSQDTKTQFAYFVDNYEANKTDGKFLINYIEARENTCLESDEMIKDYFLLQTKEDMYTKDNWAMIEKYVHDLESEQFKFVLDNREKYEVTFTKPVVDKKIEDVVAQKLRSIIKEKPFEQSKYEIAKRNFSGYNTLNMKYVIFESDLRLAAKNSDWVAYARIANENIDDYYYRKPDFLNSVAWNYYEKVDDKESLQMAIKWAKIATENESSYPYLDTYAALLYKIGDKNAALSAANLAIEQAKKDNYSKDDYKETTELLKKIKAMK